MIIGYYHNILVRPKMKKVFEIVRLPGNIEYKPVKERNSLSQKGLDRYRKSGTPCFDIHA